ncbi:MAG: helix-turn-helix transcriptional regulator [Bacteroidales bacterium]|nr:helix-turn-helix transcriptional regulator [Bacteroidales bacterium]
MNLGIIKTLCEERNIKFKDLCNVIGITDAGLYKAINNNKISAEYLEKIADYFGVSVGVFFGNNNQVSTSIFEHYALILFVFAKYYFDNNKIVPLFKKTFNNYMKTDKEFLYMSVLVTKQWKLKETDFCELQKTGVITNCQYVILKIWSKCNYDIEIFVRVYCELNDGDKMVDLANKYYKQWKSIYETIDNLSNAHLF